MYIYIFADSDFDIIDEAIHFFKANVFFRNYEIKVRFMSGIDLDI